MPTTSEDVDEDNRIISWGWQNMMECAISAIDAMIITQ
jgi:hypothetical protein